jgi:hypothetical protein
LLFSPEDYLSMTVDGVTSSVAGIGGAGVFEEEKREDGECLFADVDFEVVFAEAVE